MTEIDKMRGAAMIVRQEDADNPSVSVRRSQAFAFLSILHPEKTLEQRLQMANEIAQKEG